MKTKRTRGRLAALLSLGILICMGMTRTVAANTETEDAVSFNGNYYKAYNLQYGWNDAETYCESLGGHLVSITTADEQKIVASLAQAAGKNCYWIGTNKTLNYIWVTGEEMSYSNWGKGEPDDYQGNQGYVFICGKSVGSNSAGQWSDLSEDGSSWDNASSWGIKNFGFICEWDDEQVLSIENATVVLSADQYDYTGEEIKPGVTVTMNGTTLAEGTDYTVAYENNTNAGSGKVIVTGKGNYTGSVTKTFEIKDVNLTVKLSSSIYIYNGEARKPGVTVKYGSKTLTSGTDYSVSYKNNKNAGTASVFVTGKKTYKNKKGSATFTIEPRSVKNLSFSLSKDSYTYDGKTKKPTVTVKYGKKKLSSSKDYTVSYKDNKEIGTAVATVKGKGNFTGTKELNFYITSAFKLTLKKSFYTYDGGKKKPGVTVKKGSKTLKAGTDYTVSWENNVNASEKARVVVKGKGKYAKYGSAFQYFIILPKSITSSTVKAVVSQDADTILYTGSAVEPAVKVTDSALGKTLSFTKDYTLSYSNNVEVGKKAKVTVKGTGNYTGKVSLSFEILSAKWVWPMTSPNYSKTSWGNKLYNSSKGKYGYHVALDMTPGTSGDENVYAAADGVIVYAGKSNSNGNHIIIEHEVSGVKVKTLYSHLSSITVSSGKVTAGQKIGVYGATGRVTGAHLHFSIFTGSSNDPYGYNYDGPFTGNVTTYGGCTYYNPLYVLKNGSLPVK